MLLIPVTPGIVNRSKRTPEGVKRNTLSENHFATQYSVPVKTTAALPPPDTASATLKLDCKISDCADNFLKEELTNRTIIMRPCVTTPQSFFIEKHLNYEHSMYSFLGLKLTVVIYYFWSVPGTNLVATEKIERHLIITKDKVLTISTIATPSGK